MGSVKVNFLSYRYRADKSTIFGMRGLWGLTINSGRGTYINGFLDLEYPNFDTKHGFLSSVEAEIISFCQRRQPFAFSAFYVHPLTFEGGSPSKFDKWDLETWLKKGVSFICSVTMFNTILFYACHIRQIT